MAAYARFAFPYLSRQCSCAGVGSLKLSRLSLTLVKLDGMRYNNWRIFGLLKGRDEMNRRGFLCGGLAFAGVGATALAGDALPAPYSQPDSLSLRFLGTGAIDWETGPNEHGEVRRFTSALVEGKVLPTIVNGINGIVENKNPYSLALILFCIVLVLEFFISSSTAKAIFVMSLLSVLSLGITKEMQVLIYTFADGYTNLLFPTSPVLLIGLSMIEVSYFKWLKKSWPLFAVTFTLVVLLLVIGILINF